MATGPCSKTMGTAEPTPGCLWVIGTPIGNLEDITLRALRILREADAVLAEDTRHSKRLLQHYQIGTKLCALHAHTSESRIDGYVDAMTRGARYALVTDAGTPLVSDPGRLLVSAAHAAGISVSPIPGVSAVTAALSAVPIVSDDFLFMGFLPRRGKRRTLAIDAIVNCRNAVVLFEAPKRLKDTLTELTDRLASRRVAVCRELTKVHETIAVGTAAELASMFDETPKGEVTLVVEGAPKAPQRVTSSDDLNAHIDALRAEGLKPTDIAKQLSELLGLPRREVFQRIVSRKPQSL